MHVIQSFVVGGKLYGLYHNNEDDARYLKDEQGETLLVIDSSLNVDSPDGHFGNIESDTNWTFYYGEIRTRFDTGVSVNGHHWANLELAEVEVCKHYIHKTKLLPTFKRSEETEGGSCD